MKSQIYKQAHYYEIAFSFVDVRKQVDLFEKMIKKYSGIPVISVLDIACGTALQLEEMARRGYRAIGVDGSEHMLHYLQKKSAEQGLTISVAHADMNDFTLSEPVDFAYIMMGSIIYTRTVMGFLAHMDAVAKNMRSGGLYVIENVALNWADPKFWKKQRWTMRRGGITVTTTYQMTPKNLLTQTAVQTITLEVDDHGTKKIIHDRDVVRLFAPDEFRLLAEHSGAFEFLGFFERYAMKKLTHVSPENLIVLRKRS